MLLRLSYRVVGKAAPNSQTAGRSVTATRRPKPADRTTADTKEVCLAWAPKRGTPTNGPRVPLRYAMPPLTTFCYEANILGCESTVVVRFAFRIPKGERVENSSRPTTHVYTAPKVPHEGADQVPRVSPVFGFIHGFNNYPITDRFPTTNRLRAHALRGMPQ